MAFQVGYVYSVASIPENQWVQVAATYGAGTVSLYIDGQPVATQIGVNGFYPPIDTINLNNNAVTFGYEYNITNGYTDINTTGAELQGFAAAASVWGRVLTPSEIFSITRPMALCLTQTVSSRRCGVLFQYLPRSRLR
jgi:hypothetical protein